MDQIQNALIGAFRSESIVDRQIDELIGIIKGILADGLVTQEEVQFLLAWMDANKKAKNLWPASAIYPHLASAMSKGEMDIRDESEVLALLVSVVGGNTAPRFGSGSDSTALPLTIPAPQIIFAGKVFCFTGAFQSGSRRWCEEQIEKRGGSSVSNITKKLNYLVIGDIGNDNWLHSTHGRKIEKAVEYIDSGVSIHIVAEQHWCDHL
jgi:NAD-dependent DNA ligase